MNQPTELWAFMRVNGERQELLYVEADGHTYAMVAFTRQEYDAFHEVAQAHAPPKHPIIVRHFKATGADVAVISL
jgi:hypothetical protein